MSDFDERPGGHASTSGARRSTTSTGRVTATHRVRGVEESPELRQTLEHIGELMRLPPKRPTAAVQAVPDAAPSPSIPLGKIPVLPILAAVAIAAAAVFYFWPSAPAVVPPGLIREWSTDHQSYADRKIAFTSTAVLITAGANQAATVYPIEKITTEQRADSIRVVVTYTENGGPIELEVSLLEGTRPRLFFTRPAGLVWTPTAAP